jgi:CRP-like cAMP-binding protein
MLSERLRDADVKRIGFAASDTVGRVASRLVELADRFGEEDERGETLITLPLTQEELAAWCGSSREATAKALQTLRSLGWVETARRRITVHDLASLRARAA